MRWLAVVPIKPLREAKTRLRGAVEPARHEALVLAMACDTVAAALASTRIGEVVVVCDDPVVGAAVTAQGASCVPDKPARGLNAAIEFGAGGRPAVALTADLPALRPEDLDFLADLVDLAFVPDLEGTGTVLLAGPVLDPHFGPGSAAAHEAVGA